jgi:acyl carrier protein
MGAAAPSTAETIKRILVSKVYVEIPASEMDENASLRDVFGVDSLGFVELRAQCEDEFDITISDDDFSVEGFSTIARLTALVDRLVAERAGTPTSAAPTGAAHE